MKKSTFLFAAALLVAGVSGSPATADECLVFFGTYTKGKSESDGIYVSRLNLDTGQLSTPILAAEVTNPSFLEIHPDGKHLYSISEIAAANGKPGGGVSAFTIDGKTGRLSPINARNSGGAGPCHVNVDATGQCVLVANYSGGSAASFPVAPDGSLGPAASFHQHEGSSVNPRRQKGPHAHSINPGPNNRFAFVADLGLDKIMIYRLDPVNATLTGHGHISVAPGAGPRHFTLHPSGKWAWVINELDLTVSGFTFDPKAGTLTEFQTISTLPEGANREGASTAEVVAHPNGRFLYGSNRGHDTIAVFAIDPRDGHLTFVEAEPVQGQTPRNFAIAPGGRFLLAAGQKSNTVSVFSIAPETGALRYTGQQIKVGSPVCIRFLSR